MMNRSKLIRFVVIGVFGAGIALAGCGQIEGEATATLSPVPATQVATLVETATEAQAVETPTVHVTSEPAATATRASETPPPTNTPSATPPFAMLPTSTVPLVEGGPWLVFQATGDPRTNSNHTLWAMNPDGTGLTRLLDELIHSYDILPAQSLSDGITIAYVTGEWVGNPHCSQNELALKIVNIPDGTVQVSIPLLNAEINADCDSSSISEDEAAITMACMEMPVWSPDGTKLAFVGAMDGPSADVYTYDLATGEITRLSDGPDHAIILSWSPDSRYVIHTATSPQELGVYGIWAARSDGTGSVRLFDDLLQCEVYYRIPVLSISDYWPAPDSVLLASRGGYGNSPYNDVRQVDLDTGAITDIWPCCYADYAYDTNRDVWLFLIQDDENPETLPYLVFWENGIERRVDLNVYLVDIWWSEVWDTFIGDNMNNLAYQISYQGELEQIAALDSPESLSVHFNLSPDGQWTYWREEGFSYDTGYAAGLWVAKVGAEPTLVIDEIIDSVFWSPDGSDLYIASHVEEEHFQRLFSLYRLDLPSLEPELLVGESYPYSHFEWVP